MATTWTLANSPYYVNGPITALNDLAIEPGVVVAFNCVCGIQISGSIHVNGNFTDPVWFGSNNTSAVPAWTGIQIINPNAASSISFANIDRAQVAIDILQGNNAIDLTDVRITNATAWGIKARLLHQTSAWTNITVGDSASGVNLDDVTLLTGRSFTTFNLTGVAAFALQGNRLGTSDFNGLTFPGARIEMVDITTVTFGNVAVSSASFATGIDLVRPDTVTFSNVQIRGFTSEGLKSFTATGLIVRDINVAPLGAVQAATALWFDVSPGFQLSRATIANGTTGLYAKDSRDFVADNITVRWAATGVRVLDSPTFTLENSSIANASVVGLSITSSGNAAHVRFTQINSSLLGVSVSGTGVALAIDFSQGNAINGAPVLGVYNTPGTVVNPANAYAWVYVYGSPNVQVTGAAVQLGAGDPGTMGGP